MAFAPLIWTLKALAEPKPRAPGGRAAGLTSVEDTRRVSPGGTRRRLRARHGLRAARRGAAPRRPRRRPPRHRPPRARRRRRTDIRFSPGTITLPTVVGRRPFGCTRLVLLRPRTSGASPSSLDLGHDSPVFCVVDRLGLVDQHHRDVVADRVATLQARVVERVLVGEVVQRPLVLRAGEDLEQRRGSNAMSGTPSSGGEQGEHLGHVAVARLAGRGFEVESQQRLGVRRPQVEPPGCRSRR